jgi:hypothetical protein
MVIGIVFASNRNGLQILKKFKILLSSIRRQILTIYRIARAMNAIIVINGLTFIGRILFSGSLLFLQ